MATHNGTNEEARMASKKLQAAEQVLMGKTVLGGDYEKSMVVSVSQPGGRGGIRLTLSSGFTVGSDDVTVKHECGRCGGSGRITFYTHILAGVCFACNGSGGKFETATKVIKRQAASTARAVRLEAKAERERNERQAAAEAFMAANPGLKEAFETDLDDDRAQGILDDMHNRLVRWGNLSEKQVAYALRLTAPPVCERCGGAHKTNECPKRGEVPTGRVEITGKVLTVKLQDSAYGETLKCLVEMDNGAKVWGSVPRALGDLERGARVAFTATVERKERSFGFYKRPTGARLLAA
jgi:hypothetical protein